MFCCGRSVMGTITSLLRSYICIIIIPLKTEIMAFFIGEKMSKCKELYPYMCPVNLKNSIFE